MFYSARLLFIFNKKKSKDFYSYSTKISKAKRIQHYQICFTTNAKGTSLDINKKSITRNEKIMNGKAHW